jgi:hypothetical protein
MTTIDITFFNWAVGIFSIIVSALSVAFVRFYLDIKEDRKIDREERRIYSDKLERLIDSSNEAKKLNTIATNGLINVVDELRKDLREWRK